MSARAWTPVVIDSSDEDDPPLLRKMEQQRTCQVLARRRREKEVRRRLREQRDSKKAATLSNAATRVKNAGKLSAPRARTATTDNASTPGEAFDLSSCFARGKGWVMKSDATHGDWMEWTDREPYHFAKADTDCGWDGDLWTDEFPAGVSSGRRPGGQTDGREGVDANRGDANANEYLERVGREVDDAIRELDIQSCDPSQRVRTDRHEDEFILSLFEREAPTSNGVESRCDQVVPTVQSGPIETSECAKSATRNHAVNNELTTTIELDESEASASKNAAPNASRTQSSSTTTDGATEPGEPLQAPTQATARSTGPQPTSVRPTRVQWPANIPTLRTLFNPSDYTFPSTPTFGMCWCTEPCARSTCRNKQLGIFCAANTCRFAGACGNGLGLAESEKLRVAAGPSSMGYTVVATRPIPIDTVMGEYVGKLVVEKGEKNPTLATGCA